MKKNGTGGRPPTDERTVRPLIADYTDVDSECYLNITNAAAKYRISRATARKILKFAEVYISPKKRSESWKKVERVSHRKSSDELWKDVAALLEIKNFIEKSGYPTHISKPIVTLLEALLRPPKYK